MQRLELTHATPRPGRQTPSASARADDLPVVIGSGQTRSFSISGTYELVETDEGDKANLHLRATGAGAVSSEPFEVGINVHLRSPGARESGPVR